MELKLRRDDLRSLFRDVPVHKIGFRDLKEPVQKVVELVGKGVLIDWDGKTAMAIFAPKPWQKKKETRKPTVVCLCGSTRFWRTFQKASLDETLAGRIVLSIGAASGTDDDHFGNLPREEYDRVKAMLDDLHLRKIDLADEVLILNVDGYVGESTRREWLYAVTSGKRVRWLEPHNIPSFVDTKIVSEGFTRCPECGHEMDQNTIGEWVCLACEARRD